MEAKNESKTSENKSAMPETYMSGLQKEPRNRYKLKLELIGK